MARPMGQRIIKICPVCGKTWTTMPSDKRTFCSRICAQHSPERTAKVRETWKLKSEKARGTPPLCACGCGTPVSWYKGRWRKYVKGHWLKANPQAIKPPPPSPSTRHKISVATRVRNLVDNPMKKPDIRAKVSRALKGRRAWHTGLTKDDHPSLLRSASWNKGKSCPQLSHPSWNKGLTKNDHPSIKRQADKIRGRQRVFTSEHCKKLSEAAARRCEEGHIQVAAKQYKIQGPYGIEHLSSSYEYQRARALTEAKYRWTKRHGLHIHYFYEGRWHIYLPDFLVDNAILEEVKANWQLQLPKTRAKLSALVQLCEYAGLTPSLYTEDGIVSLAGLELPHIETYICPSVFRRIETIRQHGVGQRLPGTRPYQA